MNLYGFRRLTSGRDRGAYYHELFLRGRPDLVQKIRRIRIKGTGSKPVASPDTEPNFYNHFHPCIKKDQPELSMGLQAPDATPKTTTSSQIRTSLSECNQSASSSFETIATAVSAAASSSSSASSYHDHEASIHTQSAQTMERKESPTTPSPEIANHVGLAKEFDTGIPKTNSHFTVTGIISSWASSAAELPLSWNYPVQQPSHETFSHDDHTEQNQLLELAPRPAVLSYGQQHEKESEVFMNLQDELISVFRSSTDNEYPLPNPEYSSSTNNYQENCWTDTSSFLPLNNHPPQQDADSSPFYVDPLFFLSEDDGSLEDFPLSLEI